MKNKLVTAANVGSLFFPQREVLGLGRETITPGVREKALTCAAETRSFARAAVVLRRVGEVTLSGRHLGRLAHQVGQQLSEDQRRRAIEYDQGRLRVEVENAPELSVIEVDGGRINTRQQGQGVGACGAAWRESKNAVVMRMHSTEHPVDPTPELPAGFLDRERIKRLVAQLKGAATEDLPEGSEDALPTLPAPPYEGPQRLMRTCLSTLSDSQEFGRRLAAEAHRKGHYQAPRRAFVADGLKQNWSVHQRYFRTFTPIVDFIHVIGYVYQAALAIAGGEDFAWGLAVEQIEACWQGRAGEVIDTFRRWLADQPPTGHEPRGETDPLQTVQRAVTYLSNNRQRMNYPEYRRCGLPVTSALAESLIKEINYRVKGSEMFWNDPQGAEAILALRAASLSDDERLQLAIQK